MRELTLGAGGSGFLAVDGAASGFSRQAKLQAPDQGRESEKQREIRDVVNQAVGDNRRAIAFTAGDEEDEDHVPEPGTIGHEQRAQGGALEPVMLQRFQPPHHQQGCGEKKGEVSAGVGEAQSVDDFGERIHAGANVRP